LAFFERIAEKGVRILRIGGPFNFAKIVNKGASIATGESLLLLNNDVEALGPGWLEEMQGRLSEPDVGAVGATLLWPSGVVQHAGVVLGPSFDASHAFNERIDGDPGYGDLLRAAHEVSAVTAACMLTDRRLFLDLGGFDGLHFPVNYNDVDYCLRLRAQGLRVIQTPYAKLLHLGGASRGRHIRPDDKARLQGEMRNLRAAWGDVLLSDPYYSPLLSLDNIPFSGLAWPPRPMRPRQPSSPPQRVLPPGF
jgi:GT2 family glycosyltransferase